MPAPSSVTELLELTQKSGVVDEVRLNGYVQQLRTAGTLPTDPNKLAGLMFRDGLLTLFQAEQLLQGKWKRFFVGKYKVLEKLGSGGMGQVFLCEHKIMRRRVAVKVLPTAKADDPSSLERFLREARAVAALDHPNIVRAYDIDQDDNLHFLVMEYVDGTNFQDLIKRHGPMDPLRACHYMYQSAFGLQHAFDMAGVVHRDIKPGNILIDRSGTVKILDMGLARFFHDEVDNLTKKYDENVLGTADYLAPEQAIDSHNVDIRADIYSLGATFYFILTANPPFTEGSVAQKLIWHQSKEPKPITAYRHDVPPAVVAVIQKMMAKDPANRYQSPRELAEALEPLVQQPIPPPPEIEMPRLSPAATNNPNVVAPTGPASRVMAPPPQPKPPTNRPATSRADFLVPTSGTLAAAAAQAAPPPPPPRPRPPVAAPAPMPVRVAVSPNGTDDHVPVWTEIAGETPNPKPQSDTVRSRSIYRAPSSDGSTRGSVAGQPSKSKGIRWLLLIAGMLLLLAGLVGAAFATGLLGGKRPKNAAAVPTLPDSTGNRTLVVDTASAPQPTSFRRVQDALASARPGDRILIRGEVLRETWSAAAKSQFARGVTIEGDVPPGQYVTWKFTPLSNLDNFVLNLESVEGLTFRRIAFDGDRKAEQGIYMTGRCADIVFDDVRIINCTDVAIRLSNGYGTAEKPVRFSKVRISSEKGSRTAFDLFSLSATMTPTSAVVVEDCQLDGPFQTFVNIQGKVRDLTFRRNRCWNAATAVRIVKPTAPAPAVGAAPPLDMKIQSNTFHTVNQKTVDLEALSAVENKIEVSQNYFVSCKGLLFSPQGKSIANAVVKANARDAGCTDGNWKVEMAQADFAFKLDPNKEVEFLRYPKDSPLARIADGNPVGAPPVD